MMIAERLTQAGGRNRLPTWSARNGGGPGCATAALPAKIGLGFSNPALVLPGGARIRLSEGTALATGIETMCLGEQPRGSITYVLAANQTPLKCTPSRRNWVCAQRLLSDHRACHSFALSRKAMRSQSSGAAACLLTPPRS